MRRTHASFPGGDKPGFHQVVMDDLRQTELRRDFLQDFKDLYQFYLDDESRAELAGMGRIRRAFSLLFWVLKSLLLKLNPARRLMLLVALVFSVMGPTGFTSPSFTFGADLRPWACALLLIVLMLELRDKLLAKDEIAVARQVQLALLPNAHPDVPGWQVWSYSRPANDVGGDLVDYIPLDGFRHAVLLGDVAGKGLGAALLTAKLQATLRALVPTSPSLDDLGRQINEIFHRDGLDNRYATMFFSELEHDSGHLRYVNAGHNPAYLLRGDGVQKIHASGTPLGMFAPADYEEGAVELLPGDVILAYSDGLTEAANGEGEEFGVERLETLLPDLRGLSPEAMGSRLLREVDAFLGDARVGDDLSIAIIVKK